MRKLADMLRAAGWDRAERPSECGAVGPTTGYCTRRAYWSRLGGRLWCAQHAAKLVRR